MRKVALALSVLGLVGTVQPVLADQQSRQQSTTAPPQYVLYFRDGETGLAPDANQVVQRIIEAARKLHPGKIELIGSNDGLSLAHQQVAIERASTVASSLEKGGIKASSIVRVGNAAPAGTGIAAHKVVVRFEQAKATDEIAIAE